MDWLPTETCSKIIASIGSKNTKPELVVRRLLHALGHRFRLHRADLPGKPDIVLPRCRLALPNKGERAEVVWERQTKDAEELLTQMRHLVRNE